MFDLPSAVWPELGAWFAPERPGPLIHQQTMRAGIGRCRVDRWPDPQVVLTEVAGNYALRGDPERLRAGDLDDVAGFVEAPPEWLPTLVVADPQTASWPRLIATLPPSCDVATDLSDRHTSDPTPTDPPAADPPAADPRAADAPAADPSAGDPGTADVVGRVGVRRLGPADTEALAAYDPDGAWIMGTWGGAAGLAHARVGHGAFADGRVVSIAVPFYVGAQHADIGVVTQHTHRRRGLSTACAAAAVTDIRARGLIPTWTTSPDNAASLAVAARLGFVRHREDVLYAVRVAIPT